MSPRARTIRTVFQLVIALAAGLPLLLEASGLSEATPGVATALAVGAAVTRIMALPVTDRLLHRAGLGWLAVDQLPPEYHQD